MAEVIKNAPEQKSVPSTSDSSKSKSNSSLKQSKIGFLPRKKVVPSFVKSDTASPSKDSKDSANKSATVQNEKTPVKKTYSSDNLISKSSSEKKKLPENGGINKSNGSSTTPEKSSGSSDQDNVPLMKLKQDGQSKSIDSSKIKTKKDSSSSKHKHDSAIKSPSSHKKSSSSTSKKTANDNKDSGKKPIDNNHASTPEKSKNNSSKGRLNSSVSKGVETVNIDSSSDDDEVPLSQIRKKCTPVKSSDYDNRSPSSKSDKISAMVKKNTTPVSIVMGDQKEIPNMKGVKVDQSLKALYNRQAQNGSIPNASKKIPISSKTQKATPPPPLQNVGSKNIIIAIDMDPQKWKSLSPQEQTRIIEHKKELARKHLLAQNKAPINQPRILPNHHAVGQQVINLHANKIPNANIVINSAGIRPNAPHYYGPRTPNFSSQLNMRLGAPHIGPMQQSQQFNNFTFTQFNIKQEESTMTDLKPLPSTKKIPMPPGFPNHCFGDVAMIVEFVNTFKKFLIHSISVDAVTLMIGVSPGGAKADVVAQILLLFLKVLLSNEDYKVRGLKMELADLPLTEFTVSFLVCHFLKSQLETKKRLRKEKEFAEKAARMAEKVANLDVPNADDSDPDDQSYDYDYDVAMMSSSDEEEEEDNKKKKKKKDNTDPVEKKLTVIAKELESKEFWQLETAKQLTVMTFLLDLVVQSDDLTDYYDEVAETKAQAYRDIEEQRKKKMKMRMENAVVTLDQFTKKADTKNEDKDKTADKDKDKEEKTEEEKKDSDPFAGMTARQRDAIRSEHERNEEKKRERERFEAEQAKLDYEEMNSKFNVAVKHAKRCLRVEPLGEDRFHRVYWFFVQGMPGLYVSSRCVESIISNPLVGEIPRESWSYFNKEEDINQLLCSLTVRGLREERLKSRLREEHMAILASIKNIKEIDMHKMIRKAQEKPEDKPKVEAKQTDTSFKPVDNKENGIVKPNEEKKEEKMEVDSEKPKEVETGSKEVNTDKKESENVEKQDDKDKEKKDAVNGNANVEVNGKKDENVDKKEDSTSFDGSKENTDEHKKDAEKEVPKDKPNEEEQKDKDVEKGKEIEKGKDAQLDGKDVPKKSADTEDEDDEKIIDLIKKQEDDDSPYDAHRASIDALKSDIIESANRIVHGSLGELTELDVWSGRVRSVDSVEGLIHSCIVPKFFLNPFKPNNDDITKDWCKWVEKCMTLSTMHLLYGLLENSIKWESSAEKMRCKVCRRKKGSEQHQQIIVCDGCRFGYHTHCLRPALKFLPEGIWNCPSCAVTIEDNSKNTTIEDGEDEVTDHEDLCHECEADGTLILCDTCPLSFHLDCHKPPLRHAPRGNWSCYKCTSSRSRGKNTKGNSAKGGGRSTRTSKYAEWSSENEEASSSDEFASKKSTQNKNKKSAPAKTKTKKREPRAKRKPNSRKKRSVRNMEESVEDDDDYEEEEESSSESNEPEEQPKGRRAKRAASARIETTTIKTTSRRKKKVENDDDEEDVKKTSRSSRGKRKKVEESENEEDEEENDDDEEEPINSSNLKDKIQKFNYKKRGQQNANSEDNNTSNKNKKTNSTKGKPKKRTKLEDEEADENGNSSDSNSGGEEWEVTHISPTLGNKRPCYAKDGARKKEKARKGKGKASEDKSDTEEEKDENGVQNGAESETKEEDKKKEEAKKLEVLRNMSSADRSFRQAGRNSRRCNYEMQACRNILTSLRKHKDSWPYLTAVNLKEAPDYLSVIKKPMDFSLVLKNLDDFLYDDALQFIDDVKLIFENSKKYNIDSSPVGEAGVRLYEEFLSLLKVHLPEVLATLQT